MKIGVPRELKDKEFRVGATPASVHALVEADLTTVMTTHESSTRKGEPGRTAAGEKAHDVKVRRAAAQAGRAPRRGSRGAR